MFHHRHRQLIERQIFSRKHSCNCIMLDLGSPFFVRTEKESHSLNRESERKVMGICECFYRLNIDSIFAYFVLLLFLTL